jgi:hypothetical protein|tara:strand:+ start:33 stop:296 length:264 start_codon:yes stop_codon:yes gene_type:complete
MKTKEQVVPKWFEGIIYEEGCKVTNQISRQSFELNALELSIYDFIMGSNVVFAMSAGVDGTKHAKNYRKALSWFRVNNSDAYYVLLD